MDDLDRSISGSAAAFEDLDRLDIEVRRRDLIARLVALRKSNGLTQAAVADVMRVRQSVIAEIESGRTDVRLSTLERYAAAASRGQLQLELARDAWAPGSAGGLAETVAPYGRAVEESDFWAAPSLADLVAEQRTTPITDPQALALEGVSEHDWDDFFVAMGLPE